MQGIPLTQTQKKILIIGGAVALVFLLLWFFVFLPMRAATDKIKTDLAALEAQIREIETSCGQAKTFAENIRAMEIRYRAVENKFPSDIQESLKAIAKIAGQFNVNIDSLKPSFKKPLLDKANKEVVLDGRRCETIHVTLVIQGSYEGLVNFREALEEGLPGFIAAETLGVSRNSVNAPEQITSTLAFNFYLLD
ncbi:MAG: hypothetical protein WCI27_09100 [Candidatus Omnitrophota bacterium]